MKTVTVRFNLGWIMSNPYGYLAEDHLCVNKGNKVLVPCPVGEGIYMPAEVLEVCESSPVTKAKLFVDSKISESEYSIYTKS